jgi:DNA-directed RNA polymerase subunit RPC12/RpoP
MKLVKRYILYLIRWQLSTPILAVVLSLLSGMNTWAATIIANLIGGLIFFWVDKLIFKKKTDLPLWEIEEEVECADCHKKTRGYRIVEWGNYDRSNDKNPQFRCQECSLKKMELISNNLQKKN